MKSQAELLAEGREVVERLHMTGEHPQVLRKLEDIIAAPAAQQHGGAMLKLQNLLTLVAVKPAKKVKAK